MTSLLTFRPWRVWMAFVDATLIAFGLWWLHERTLAWIPSSVMLVLLTVFWLCEFVSEALNGC